VGPLVLPAVAAVVSVDVTPVGWAHGGEAVARVDGKAVFIPDVLPGERARVEIVDDRRSWARADLVEVVEMSPNRVAPPCTVFSECGGCQWQYADYPTQAAAKQEILSDQLVHLGGLSEPPVRPTVSPGPALGYRNRMTFQVRDGSPAMYRKRSRTPVRIPECLLLTPILADLYGRLGPLDGVKEITLRAGVRTGDVLVIVRGEVPDQAASWNASVVHKNRAIHGGTFIHEQVAGVRFRVSGKAFFQVNTHGADSLVELVREALAPQPDEVLLDGYAGVGLFSATAGTSRVVAVESDGRAIDDLKLNLAHVDATTVQGRFEDGVDARWDIAVVDPPRTGLGVHGTLVVASSSPRAIAYVSCDPASLARDIRYLDRLGYDCRWVTPVDMFPQTFHIESVAAFARRG